MLDRDSNNLTPETEKKGYSIKRRAALVGGFSTLGILFVAPALRKPVNAQDQGIEPTATATRTIPRADTTRGTHPAPATMTPDIQAIKIRTMEGLISNTEQRNSRLEGTLVAQSTVIAQLSQRNRNQEAIDRSSLRVLETTVTSAVVFATGIGLMIAVRVFGAPRSGSGGHGGGHGH